MEFHEVCSLFPGMTDDEFRELSFDIAKHGVLEPIWVHSGQIIDGRHRYRAAMAMGIQFETREWNGEGGSLLGFVASKGKDTH
jgi:hypothetical protein